MVWKYFTKCFTMALTLAFVCLNAEAALLPDDARTMDEAFLKSADIQAAISLVKLDSEILCGVKSALRTACQCSAVYEIIEIFKKPTALGLKVKDVLILDYPCDNKKNMQWPGSTVSWAIPQKDGLLFMRLPFGYLKPRSRQRWIIDNQGNIFSPVKPVAHGETFKNREPH